MMIARSIELNLLCVRTYIQGLFDGMELYGEEENINGEFFENEK
jgi:hypothetical protein